MRRNSASTNRTAHTRIVCDWWFHPDLIADAHENDVPLMMTVVNAGEVWYIIAREASESDAENGVKELQDLGIEFVDADWKLTRTAAAFKAKHRTRPERSRGLSFADCFAAALAKERKAELVTGDQDFKVVEAECTLTWV